MLEHDGYLAQEPLSPPVQSLKYLKGQDPTDLDPREAIEYQNMSPETGLRATKCQSSSTESQEKLSEEEGRSVPAALALFLENVSSWLDVIATSVPGKDCNV